MSGVTAGGGILIGAVAYALFSRGAFYGPQFKVFFVLCVVGLGLESARRLRFGEARLAVPLGFGAVMLAGSLVAAVGAGSLGDGLPTFGVVVVVTAALVVGSAERGLSRGLVDGLLLCALLVAGSAWVGVAFHFGPWGLVVEGLWRGASVITYTNAAAAFVGMMLVVAAGRLVCVPSRSGRLVVWGLAVGLTVTMSRAAAAAVVVGLVVVAVGAGWRRTLRALLTVAPGVVVAVGGLVPGLLAGSSARPLVAVVALGVGLAAVWLTIAARKAAAVCVVAVCVLVVGVGGTGRVFDELVRTRFVAGSDDRGGEWGAAVGEFVDRPLTGQGPGRATFVWRASDGRWLRARFAHNEYLELAATHGLVGLGALVAAVALVVYGGVRRRTLSGGGLFTVDGDRVGAAGGLVVFGVHSAFDFLWHVPVLPVVAGLLAGFLLAPGRPNQMGPSSGHPDASLGSVPGTGLVSDDTHLLSATLAEDALVL